MNKDIFHFTGIRKKLIAYYLITTVLLGVTSVFSYYNARIVLTGLKTIIRDYVYLNSLNNDVNALMTEVEEYLTTKSSESILNYYTTLNALQEKSRNIPRKAVYDLDSLMLKDIGYMIDELLNETDHAVRAKRGRISSEYIAHFSRANQISEYIKFYINTLLNRKLQKGSLGYDEITKSLTVVSYINLTIIILSVFINIFLAIFFTYRLTKPIVDLSHSAERISKGDFDIQPTKIETDDEISILAAAFDKMVISIKNYIDEIKKQAEFENRLKEQEMQNFKMKSLLKDAELKSLQSQIHPHFLFNTLNAASQLSMMEGADRASEFIENIAELFRYNLRRLDEPVTLADEVKYVKNYMYILKTRFGDRIQFFEDIEEDVMGVKIPCTILQPIVENAYIHGLENMERNGAIYLNVRKQSSEIHIEIIDNGMGMDKDRVKSILFMDAKEDLSRRHVTGIGIHNVIDRLRLFYNIADIHDVIEIESKLGYGTKITLKIPYLEGVKEDDKAFNR
ncbi:sensor histidine kinase [Geosporobacter ferrireducens]|uniref:histidine kinase n=1 Tax=Geosporobacter ferrireducens TaxID=1424294 RepID=A0A1D8GIM8_9FIRM|nr:sensor histidine kinase [Geosporobacter ferrireducens]AOT70751.1 ATPase [Geosporobacter ferrireducens]MTI57558.1 sensor histidine kinase [Geosporobacter ferrireducens]